jgi:HNH endonuclease
MRCIFCKADSKLSRSVEHVIPESLGNSTLVLPKGVVCDPCNNYFSREVEKPFLEAPAIRIMRFHQALESKKGRVPKLAGIITPGAPAILTRFPRHDYTSVAVSPDAFESVQKARQGELILPIDGPLPKGPIVSRFLAKVAVEALATRIVQYSEGLEYLCDESQLDDLRDHARRGKIIDWPVHVRRIYSANAKTFGEDGKPEQVIHESDFLVTSRSEWYFALALFGLEFAINLGGPEIDGYRQWLKENNNASPLYLATKPSPFAKPTD